MKKIFNTIFIFCLFASSFAQIDRSQPPKSGPAPEINLKDPKIFELKNGLKVFVVENNKLPRVNAYLTLDNPAYNAGSLIAANDLIGSMLGEGTTNMSKDDFNERIDFLGASLGFTANGANMNALSKYYKEVLTMMADAIKNPLFTEKEFEKEKQNLITGIKSNENDVGTIADRVRRIATYGENHPYAEYTSMEDAENSKFSDIQALFSKYYIPNNAYLIVAGDVKYNDVKKLVEKEFAGWKRGADINEENPKPQSLNETIITLVDVPNAVQSNLQLSYPVEFKMNDKDYLAMQLAGQIFGGSFNSRLNLNLREKHGYTYGARGGIRADKTMGRFFANSLVRNEVTDSAVVQSMYELENLVKNGVTQKELDNAKANFTGDFVRDLEDSRNQAFNTLNLYTEDLPKDFYTNYLTNLNKVTVDDVNRVIKEYYQPKKVNIVATGKAQEVLPNLKKLGYPIQYVDKWGKTTSEPVVKVKAKEEALPIVSAKVTDIKNTDEIIKNYINAIGGSDSKLKSVKSVKLDGSLSVAGQSGSFTWTYVSPNKEILELKGLAPVVIGVGFDGESNFVKQGANKVKQPNTDDYNLKREFYFNQLNYENTDLTYEGTTDLDGKEAFNVKVVKNGKTQNEYYELATGYLIQIDEESSQGKQTVKFANYEANGGIMFPSDITLPSPYGPMILKVSNVEINPEIDEAIFN